MQTWRRSDWEGRARLRAAHKDIVNVKVLIAHMVVSSSLVLAGCVANIS
jgi:hypothetical protein